MQCKVLRQHWCERLAQFVLQSAHIAHHDWAEDHEHVSESFARLFGVCGKTGDWLHGMTVANVVGWVAGYERHEPCSWSRSRGWQNSRWATWA